MFNIFWFFSVLVFVRAGSTSAPNAFCIYSKIIRKSYPQDLNSRAQHASLSVELIFCHLQSSSNGKDASESDPREGGDAACASHDRHLLTTTGRDMTIGARAAGGDRDHRSGGVGRGGGVVAVDN